MRSNHRPCEQTDAENRHDDDFDQKDPAQGGHTEEQKGKRCTPEDGEAEEFGGRDFGTCR